MRCAFGLAPSDDGAKEVPPVAATPDEAPAPRTPAQDDTSTVLDETPYWKEVRPDYAPESRPGIHYIFWYSE